MEVLDEAGEGDIEIDTPADPRASPRALRAAFPANRLERVGTDSAWFALSVGDDFESDPASPGVVFDRCPDGENSQQIEPNLPLR